MSHIELNKRFAIRPLSQAEFAEFSEQHGKAIFGDIIQTFRYQQVLSEAERQKQDALSARLGNPYRLYLGAFEGDRLAGWTWGIQESSEAFYMVNSAVLPEFRGQGVYTALLSTLLEEVTALGFQRIYSRHIATNNQVIVPKLKAGFIMTAFELSDRFGTLVQLTYFPHPMRRKVLEYRAGQSELDDEVRSLLKQ